MIITVLCAKYVCPNLVQNCFILVTMTPLFYSCYDDTLDLFLFDDTLVSKTYKHFDVLRYFY
jgi:hypothetical protein